MRVMAIAALIGTLAAVAPAYGQYYGGYHASTAAESYQRGFADIVRSAGAANYMNSEAAKNVEQARSQYIDNRLKATQTYFEMKRYNKEYREATAKPRPTSEQLFRLAKEATPDRLSPADLDPVTGKINWPAVLRADGYETFRTNLDGLYADRANASGKIGLEHYQQIRENIRAMQDELKGQISDIPPQVFSSANAFLKRLEYTAQGAG